MNRQTLIGGLVLILALGGLFFYVGLTPTPPKALVTSTNLPPLGYIEHTPTESIEVYYASSTPFAEPANTTDTNLMRSFIADTVNDFKSSGANASSTLDIVYLIGSSARTISYIFTIETNYAEAAHSNESFKTFTFDRQTGAPLLLADLFVSGSDYLTTLSKIARARLPEVIGDGYDMTAIKDGTEAKAENFQNFLFDNSDFVILFPPYQVASYSEGPQTLRIPVSLLSSILKPEYR